MLAMVIKAYRVNVVVDRKPIYLNKNIKQTLFQNKTYYLEKICFAKIKLSKLTI